MASFRQAHRDGSEDEILARILYNAFLDAWEVNWWQSLNTLLEPIPVDRTAIPVLSSHQASRLQFYRALLVLSRMIGAEIAVATLDTPTPRTNIGQVQVEANSSFSKDERPVAMIIWLPPRVRPTFLSLFRSGFLSAAFKCFGLIGLYRLWYFENELSKLYARALDPLGYKQEHGAFVQIIATDPDHAGHGYSADLLQWEIDRHKKSIDQGDPVFLDTVSDFGQKVYERLGFTMLVKGRIETGRGAKGLPFGADISSEEREEIARGLGQKIFILA